MKLKFYPLVVLLGLLLVCGCKEKPENKLFPPDPEVCNEKIEIEAPRGSWVYSLEFISKWSQMGCLRSLYQTVNDGDKLGELRDKDNFLLFAAVVAQNEQEVKALISKGAKVGQTILQWAADYGNREIIRELLKAEIESEPMWRGAMFATISVSPEDIALDYIQELINRKFDLNYRTNECGSTLWIFAKSSNRARVVQVLEKQGVKPTQNDKNVALQLAALKTLSDGKTKGNAEVVKQLVKEGADVNATTKCGKMPIYQKVKEYGTFEMAILFKSLGAHD